MDPLNKALSEVFSLDELARKNSFLHGLHPLIKIIATVAYIAILMSFSPRNIFGIIPMILIPLVWYQLGEISLLTCFYRLRFLLPIICFVGIWNPVFDHTWGWISFFTLLIKGVSALMVSFLLIATTGIEKICYGLRLIHIPTVLVTGILITYRYLSLLLREASVSYQAYMLRAPGQRGIRFSAWGSFLGQLLIRTMDRGEMLFQSMLLRGYNGNFYFSDYPGFAPENWIFLVISLGVMAVFRAFNIPVVLGELFNV